MTRKIKRRQLLIGGLLGGFGLARLHSFLQGNPMGGLMESAIAADPPPNSDLLFRFVSVADTGTGFRAQRSVARAMKRYYNENPYPLVVLAGDNIYNEGEIEKVEQVFEKPYAALLENNVTFRAVLGNHDIRTENGNPQVAYPGFNMDGRYYTFRHGEVQFFALDTNHNADWKNQMPWLESALRDSDAHWKIVFGHHQIFASGVYGPNKANWVKPLIDLFKEYEVRLYINGHEHHYERTQPIDGITYLTCGGGAGLRPVVPSPWTAYGVSRLSFAAYDVYADRIIIKGIGTNNLVFDQGVVWRS